MKFTSEETAAIKKLRPECSLTSELLGETQRTLPPDWYQPGGDPTIDYRERLRAIEDRLLGYLTTMAVELDELPDEQARLRSEALGILLALRDIGNDFPEVER